MMASIVLTLIGPDRPGLVSAIAQRVAAADGNWLGSRMSSLAGQFAGLLHVSVPDDKADTLIDGLSSLERDGLRLVIARGRADGQPVGERDPGQNQPGLTVTGDTVAQGAAGHASGESAMPFTMELSGLDRPGIVRDLADALAQRGISIEDMETGFFSAPFSGEGMFEMTADLRVPPGMTRDSLQALLDEMASRHVVEISLGAGT